MTPLKYYFIFAATGTSLTQYFCEPGFIKALKIVTPDFTNSITVTTTITDPEGVNIFTKTAQAKNNTTTYGYDITAADLGSIPVGKKYPITVTLSGVAGGTGGTVTVSIALEA